MDTTNNKTWWYVIGAIVVIIIIIVAIVMASKGKSGSTASSTPETTTTTTTTTGSNGNQVQGVATTGSLRSLISTGASKSCTFKTLTSDTAVNGKVYAASGDLHIDFSSVSKGQTQSGHMILKDDKSYVWIDGQSQGYVIASTPNQTSPNPTVRSIDVDSNVSYTCSNWLQDPAEFALPATVQFKDMSQMQMGNYGMGS